jgi:hypothetical protein
VGALVWWLIPLTFTLLAIVWVTWVNRPRRPADAHDSLAAHQRFTAALQRSEDAARSVPSERRDVDSASDASNVDSVAESDPHPRTD